MKNNFEAFISQHKGDMPLENPPTGHREAFISKLDAGHEKSNRKLYWTVAATLVLLSSLVWVFTNLNQSNSTEMTSTADEFKTQKLLKEENKMEQVIAIQTQEILSKENYNKTLVANTLKELKKLENEYSKMEQDLMISGNEKVLEAMQENLEARNKILSEAKSHLNP